MDSYGVLAVGDYLFSVPGFLLWLLGLFVVLVWSGAARRPLWEFILSIVMFNIGWNLLGLSFWILA